MTGPTPSLIHRPRSRAAKVTRQELGALLCETHKRQARTKFSTKPRRPETDGALLAVAAEAAPVQISNNELFDAVRQIVRGQCNDMHGWSGEVLKAIIECKESRGLLAKLVSDLINDKIDETVARHWLIASELVLVGDKSRPIGISSWVLKLADRVVTNRIRRAMQNAENLKPSLRYLLSLARDGCPAMTALAQQSTDAPGFSVMSDVKNAFNSVSNDQIRDLFATNTYLKPFAKFGFWRFARPSPHMLVCKHGELLDAVPAHQGVIQGSPLSPIIFAIAALPVFEFLGADSAYADDSFRHAHNIEDLNRYLDRTLMLSARNEADHKSDLDSLDDAGRTRLEAAWSTGLRTSLAKTEVMAHATTDPASVEVAQTKCAEAGVSFIPASQSMMVLGIPIGTVAARTEAIATILADKIELAHHLLLLECPQNALYLLRVHVSRRFEYYSRNLDHRVLTPHMLERFQSRLDAIFMLIVNAQSEPFNRLSPSQLLSVAKQPINKGGLGLSDIASGQSIDRISGILSAITALHKLDFTADLSTSQSAMFQELSLLQPLDPAEKKALFEEPILPFFRDAQALDPRGKSPKAWLSIQKGTRKNATWNRVRVTLPHATKLNLLHLSTKHTRSAHALFSNPVPSFMREGLRPAVFLSALAHRFGLDQHAPSFNCSLECNVAADAKYPGHAHRCNKINLQPRHDTINSTIVSEIRPAVLFIHSEPMAARGVNQKRFDHMFRSLDGKMIVTDGTVITHRTASVRVKEPTAASAGAAMIAAHTRKVSKYKLEVKALSKRLGEQVKFVPWVFSELGVAHASTVSFLNSMSKQLPSDERRGMLTRVYTRLAYALARVNFANEHSYKARAYAAR